jgi:hypothetical protein
MNSKGLKEEPIFLESRKKKEEQTPILPIINKRFLKKANDVDVKAAGVISKVVCVERSRSKKYVALTKISSGITSVTKKKGRQGKTKSKAGNKTPG